MGDWRSKLRGFQKNSILFFTELMLKESGRPMTYEEMHRIALEKGYDNPSISRGSTVFVRRIKEDIAQKKDKSPFQVVGYKQIGFREWGYPDFNEDKYREKLKEEELKNRKVKVMTAIIEALENRGEPMRVKEIYEYVKNRKNVIIKSKNPFKTVNSNITHEILKRGDQARFVRISKGMIGLRKWSRK